MLISSKGRYALRLMIYIAALGDAEGKIALREVADREHISQKYLEQLVRPLMKAGLLKSVRGKGGGYMMAKDPAEVRAGDILRAVEGSTAPVACDGIDNSCARSDLCSTVKFWRGLDDVIEKYVDGVTLADLAAVPEINFDIKLYVERNSLRFRGGLLPFTEGLLCNNGRAAILSFIFANCTLTTPMQGGSYAAQAFCYCRGPDAGAFV